MGNKVCPTVVISCTPACLSFKIAFLNYTHTHARHYSGIHSHSILCANHDGGHRGHKEEEGQESFLLGPGRRQIISEQEQQLQIVDH